MRDKRFNNVGMLKDNLRWLEENRFDLEMDDTELNSLDGYELTNEEYQRHLLIINAKSLPKRGNGFH